MISIRQILNKIFPKLNALEESPTCIVKPPVSGSSIDPFNPDSVETYDQGIEVPCIYSEQPEIASSNNNIVLKQVMYIYIKQDDIDYIDESYRIIFNNKRYRPTEIQNLFGLWKLKVFKE